MRYVVKNAANLYMNGFESVGKHDVLEGDGSGAFVKHKRDLVRPTFHAVRWQEACKYGTESDAADAMKQAYVDAADRPGTHLAEPKDFDGCTVQAVPDLNVETLTP